MNANDTIRRAASLDFAAEEAARAWVLTDDAAYFFPGLDNQLLQRVDALKGSVRMAPIVAISGQEMPDMARSFWCFPDDVREVS
jgi:hypothetical protein